MDARQKGSNKSIRTKKISDKTGGKSGRGTRANSDIYYDMGEKKTGKIQRAGGEKKTGPLNERRRPRKKARVGKSKSKKATKHGKR